MFIQPFGGSGEWREASGSHAQLATRMPDQSRRLARRADVESAGRFGGYCIAMTLLRPGDCLPRTSYRSSSGRADRPAAAAALRHVDWRRR
jgi:hypothetical protein